MGQDPITSARAVKEFFDRPSRGAPLSPVGLYTQQQIASLLPTAVAEGAIAVDLGCNVGSYTLLLADQFKMVYGLDFATAPMRQMPKRSNVRLIAIDLNTPVEQMWLKLKVDFALAVGLFEMLPQPERACETLESWIVPGGQLLIVMPRLRTVHLLGIRLMTEAKRLLDGRNRPPLFHNRHSLSTVQASLETHRFDCVKKGELVGFPAAIVSVLPRSIQRMFIRCDHLLVRPGHSCYEFGLFVRRQ